MEKSGSFLNVRALKPAELDDDSLRSLSGVFSVNEVEYHAGPGVSKSMLVDLLRSPGHMKWKLENKEEPTDPMIFGTAFHCAMLEPDRFDQLFVIAPKINRRSNAGKEEYAAWCAANAGKTALESEQLDTLQKMVTSMESHEVASLLLSEGLAEVSAYWQSVEGLLSRARADYVRPGLIDENKIVLIDIKTTQDASLDAFSKEIANRNYHIQAAYYSDGFERATGKEVEAFFFIAIEKSGPFGVQVFNCSKGLVERGRADYTGALFEYKRCMEADEWPTYSDKVLEIDLPRWK